MEAAEGFLEGGGQDGVLHRWHDGVVRNSGPAGEGAEDAELCDHHVHAHAEHRRPRPQLNVGTIVAALSHVSAVLCHRHLAFAASLYDVMVGVDRVSHRMLPVCAQEGLGVANHPVHHFGPTRRVGQSHPLQRGPATRRAVRRRQPHSPEECKYILDVPVDRVKEARTASLGVNQQDLL